jgi:hypothetical protein
MKLLSRWIRDLSVASALLVASSQAWGQGGMPPMTMGHPAAAGMMPYPVPLPDGPDGDIPHSIVGPSSCDGMACGPGGCFDPHLGQRFGQGCGYACGNTCGPLGCQGGTFGDGRCLGDLLRHIASKLAGFGCAVITPYGEGGVASQRWFDLSAEAVFLTRSQGAGLIPFSSQGIGTVSPDGSVVGDFVLDSDDVDLDNLEPGLGLQANVQVGPGSNLEVVYFGLNKWEESATVNSLNGTPTLFSFFSDFGTDPFNGFDDPDRSFTHSLAYESTLNNGEVNLRRRWAEPAGFFQGSFLAGIRYFDLDEQASFQARGENNNTAANNGPRFFNYDTRTENQLTGFQLGTDLWLNLIPGVKLGTEVKAGIFGNHATQDTTIIANSLPGFGISSIDERASDGRTAYLVQYSAQAVYRLTYAIALRSSFQVIYVDNVALAVENFNGEPPALFLPNSSRVVSINNDAEVLYTGFTFGAEYMW